MKELGGLSGTQALQVRKIVRAEIEKFDREQEAAYESAVAASEHCSGGLDEQLAEAAEDTPGNTDAVETETPDATGE